MANNTKENWNFSEPKVTFYNCLLFLQQSKTQGYSIYYYIQWLNFSISKIINYNVIFM